MARAIALLSLLLIAATPSPLPDQQQSKAADHQTAAEAVQPEASKTAIIAAAISLPAPGTDAGEVSDQPWSYWEAVAPSTWSTWGLATFAAIAAWIALHTLGAIKRQTEIAAVAERAWIAFDLAPNQIVGMEQLVFWRGNSQQFTPQMGTLVHALTTNHSFVNGGKTIGRVKGGTVKFICINPDNLPAEPNYSGPGGLTVPEFLILPHTPIVGSAYLVLNGQEILDLFNGDRALVVYGFISYDDILGDPHESRFCLICRFPRAWPVPIAFLFGGPSAYNRYT